MAEAEFPRYDHSLTTDGTIDDIFDVLSKYEHPFVLVGVTAHRWMGCKGVPGEGFDILIRNDQLNSIVNDLVATNNWAMFDPDPERKELASNPLQEVHARGRKMLLSYCHDADVALKSVGPLNTAYSYLRLWS